MKALVASFSILALLLIACERDTTNDAFAQCLDDSGTVFYGAFWCPHCQDQKEMFGDSADLLPYVECAQGGKNAQLELCAEQQIKSYPTWKFTDGTSQTGLMDFAALSEKTNCPLPGNESLMR